MADFKKDDNKEYCDMTIYEKCWNEIKVLYKKEVLDQFPDYVEGCSRLHEDEAKRYFKVAVDFWCKTCPQNRRRTRGCYSERFT